MSSKLKLWVTPRAYMKELTMGLNPGKTFLYRQLSLDQRVIGNVIHDCRVRFGLNLTLLF